MARRLYVYYRVAEPALTATVHAVQGLQAGLLARHPGLQAQLLRRPELQGGEVTLMEAYAGAITPALAAAIGQAAAAISALPQPRHVELFDELAEAATPPE